MAATLCWLVVLLAAAARALAIVTSKDPVQLSYEYHDHDNMTAYLRSLNDTFPDIANLYSAGKSVRGKDLWVLELSGAGDSQQGVPYVKLVGNIHGNEPAGREIILHLAQFLVTKYNRSEDVRWLLNNTRIHLMPSMNPDGFQISQERTCYGNLGRENARSVDLNRNFPDHFRPNTIPGQPERDAVVAWLGSRPFLLSASLHGGALVANYPFDNTPEDKWLMLLETLDSSEINEDDPFGIKKRYNETGFMHEPSPTPDDDVFLHLATSYAAAHPTMHASPREHLGTTCGRNSFQQGVTNGAAWYPVTGGMQDYNYVEHGCFELTLEVSCCKYPAASLLPQLWDENRQALLEFINQAHRGVKGVVRNYVTNESVPGAYMMVGRRNIGFRTSPTGEFWRILLPGNYNLKVYKEGYENLTMSFNVVEPARPWSDSATWLDVALYPAGMQVTRPTTRSTSTTAATPPPTGPATTPRWTNAQRSSARPRASDFSAQASHLSGATVARKLHAAAALALSVLHCVCTW